MKREDQKNWKENHLRAYEAQLDDISYLVSVEEEKKRADRHCPAPKFEA